MARRRSSPRASARAAPAISRRSRSGRDPAAPSARRTATISPIVTCEHGGNCVPRELERLFRGHEKLLASHRGWDPGALDLAGRIAIAINAPLVFSVISRLIVDLNRSPSNEQLLSPLTSTLPSEHTADILDRHYRPYRALIAKRVDDATRAGHSVVHLSIHTFTPVLRGRRRGVDIGILFDPSRRPEARFARRARHELTVALPRLRIRFNEPYRGTDDGLTKALRVGRADVTYAGIELEINQRFARRGGAAWERLQNAIAGAIATTIAQLDPNDPHA